MDNEMPEWLEKEKVKAKRELESSFVEAANRCGINWTEPHSLIVDDTANYCFQKCYELVSQRQNDIMLKQELKIEQLKESMKPRPIESAPKDGTDILLRDEMEEGTLAEYCVGYWGPLPTYEKGWIVYIDNFEPTHWLPLPSIDHIADVSKKVGGKND